MSVMRHRGIGRLTELAMARALPVLLVPWIAACHSAPMDPAGAHGIAAIQVLPDSATITSGASVFNSDGTFYLSVAYLDQAGKPIEASISPTWSSSDESVATVSQSGIVIGMMPGVAIIAATTGNLRGYAKVAVLPVVDTGLTVVAHRGFQGVLPENTLVAISGAFERGADAVEIDVRYTADGTPILMHDPTVDRTTNGVGAVRFLALTQIEQLDACSKFGPTWSPCPVPTLREALGAARGHGLLILDLKDTYTNPVPLSSTELAVLFNLIRDEGMSQHVILASINYNALQRLRQMDDSIPLGFFDMGIPRIDSLIQLGRAVGMPEEHALFTDSAACSAMVRAAFDQRMDIMAFTAISLDEARTLVRLGIRRIMSNVPLDRKALR